MPARGPELAVAVLALVALGAPAPAAAQGETWRALRGLRAVAVEVSFTVDHPAIAPEAVERRLVELLAAAEPAPRVDPRSQETLRVLLGVAPVSANQLRGFYLPFSGTYGVGSVRLRVERPALLPGQPQPVPAVVWEAERLAAGPWHRSATEVLALVGELGGLFLDEYRRAVGQ